MKTKISVLWPWYQYENWSLGVFLQVPTANQKSRLIFHHKMLLLSTCCSHFVTNKSVLSTFHGSITIFSLLVKIYIRLVLWKVMKLWGPLEAIFLIKFLVGNKYFQMWLVDVANSQFSVPPKICFLHPNLISKRNQTYFSEEISDFLTKNQSQNDNFDEIYVHSWESILTCEHSVNINLAENGSFWPIACRSMGKFRKKVRGDKPQRRDKVENCRVQCVTRN